jgi:hypothetical protein
MGKKTRKSSLNDRLDRIIAKIMGLTEEQAIDKLEGEDLIIAEHCFYEVFGHCFDPN